MLTPQADLHVLGMLRFMSAGPLLFILFSVSVFMALSTVFHSINSCLISALLVLSAIYLFRKVSLSSDIILCDWLALKRQLNNLYVDTQLMLCVLLFALSSSGSGRCEHRWSWLGWGLWHVWCRIQCTQARLLHDQDGVWNCHTVSFSVHFGLNFLCVWEMRWKG